MGDLYVLSRLQFNWIKPYFPLLYGFQRVDDFGLVSGIIYVIKQ
jgi:hypothetical protein